MLKEEYQVNEHTMLVYIHLKKRLNISNFLLTWKSFSSRISFFHLTKKAAQTYKWKWEKPSGSDCLKKEKTYMWSNINRNEILLLCSYLRSNPGTKI